MAVTQIQPVILIILDGWGIAPPSQGNAVTLAKVPVFNKLTSLYPTMTLQASGEAVGLPWGEMGNSEVGHLNLGAGKIVWQNLPRISRAIKDGSFFNNQVFLKAIEHAKKNQSNLHLIGLISNGAVHSSLEHLYALLEMAAKNKFKNVFIHAILDGRDTPQDSGRVFINELLNKIKKIGVGQIASLSGRFYAMDRDNHWERVEKSYLVMTQGSTEQKFTNPLQAIESSYKNKVYDEEFLPVVITQNNQSIGQIKDNDATIFFNFRSDRARELTKAFVAKGFKGFKREKIKNLFFATMTEYEKDLPVEIAFPPEKIESPLAKIISDQGFKQFHTAETEKYAHVTFFFNGGCEQAYPGEKRALVPSPRISSYDQKPEMSAPKVAEQVIKALNSDKYQFIIVNFANPDMVGHTGNLKASIKALEVIDELLGQIVDLTLKKDWVSVLVADHGNVEEMINMETGEIDTKHSTYPVPFILINKKLKNKKLKKDGVLGDIAPTILELLGEKKPPEMTGKSLIKK